MVSTVAVPSNVHLSDSETSVSAIVSEGSSNALGPMEISEDTCSVEIDEVNHEKVASAP